MINRAYSNTWPDVYGYGEQVPVRIIAYNSKNDKRQVNTCNYASVRMRAASIRE